MSRALGAGLAGAALVLCAAAFDALPLYVPGVGLLTLGLGSAAWVLAAASGASVERLLAGGRVQEEEAFSVRLRLRPGLLPAPVSELRDPLIGSRTTRLHRGREQIRIDVRFARRGRRRLEPSRVVLRDPLGLAVRELESQAAEVLVLPRIEPVIGAGGAGGAEGASAAPGRLGAVAAELELDSLRPYREGTPASRVHWPTVARTGEMIERRLVAEGEDRPLVALDARGPAGEEALDRAVRAAASLVVHFARAGGCGLVLPGERRPLEVSSDLLGWPTLHARFAAVEEAERPPSLERAGRRGAIVWVSAHRGPAPAALTRAQAASRVLVSPDAEDRQGTRALFTVSGCSGRAVGRSPRVRRAA